MVKIRIIKVGKAEIGMLDTALRDLSDTLGDSHNANAASLKQAAFGTHPSIHAMIAHKGDQVLGAVVFCPTYSTTLGTAGLFVSDLWVADMARGTGLGRRLLGTRCRLGK